MPCGLAVRHSSISPSKTVSAGPVMQHRLASPPAHSMRQRAAARVRRRTCGRAGRSRMPATTAAQAPVPQASVSPAPRSYTRSADVAARRRTCMKPALTRRGKRAWRSISGPLRADRRGVDVVDHLHRVRVAHRQHRDSTLRRRPASSGHSSKSPSRRGARPAASNGTRAGSNTGAPMSTVTRPSASQAQLDHAVDGLDADRASCRSGPCRARSARSSARRCRTARPRRRRR